MPIAIDRRSGLSQTEFNAEYVATSTPVILTDATDHWPARRSWDLDYFESRFPDKVLSFDGKDWRLGDLIQILKQPGGDGSTPYLKEVKLDEQFPELWSDIGTIALASGNRLKSALLPASMRIDRGTVALFIGTRGSGFRKLHWDFSHLHVFISQIHGGKDAILFSPQDTPFLYPDPQFDNLSLIPDPHHVDLQAFPAFSRADPTRITIAQGETLFLPNGWWHATRINEPSIAIAESTLDAYNWAVRKDWYLDSYARAKVPALKRQALSLYMDIVGRIL